MTMLPGERLDLISSRLQDTGKVIAADLARELGVSEDTIRRDLRDLSARGVCERVYGGALRLPASAATTLSERAGRSVEAKAALAREAVKLSVNGIVIKSTAPRDLLVCLESVVQGRRWIDQEVMQRVMEQAMSPDAPRDPFDALSARERAVASLVQRGLRNKEVASELGLTEGTVKVHLHKVFDKLGIRGRTELILLAQERGD